ncbi:MAG TPA: Hsp20/alpha crystallin family protein [bacterium]
MLVKWTPFQNLLSSESLLSDFFGNGLALPEMAFDPKIEVKETEKNFIIRAELPGINREDFKLFIEGDHLILEGEKKAELEKKNDGYYRSERSYGAFRRAFRLTDEIDHKKVDAEFKNGLLTVTLNKTEKAQPRQVEVKIS